MATGRNGRWAAWRGAARVRWAGLVWVPTLVDAANDLVHANAGFRVIRRAEEETADRVGLRREQSLGLRSGDLVARAEVLGEDVVAVLEVE